MTKSSEIFIASLFTLTLSAGAAIAGEVFSDRYCGVDGVDEVDYTDSQSDCIEMHRSALIGGAAGAMAGLTISVPLVLNTQSESDNNRISTPSRSSGRY